MESEDPVEKDERLRCQFFNLRESCMCGKIISRSGDDLTVRKLFDVLNHLFVNSVSIFASCLRFVAVSCSFHVCLVF